MNGSKTVVYLRPTNIRSLPASLMCYVYNPNTFSSGTPTWLACCEAWEHIQAGYTRPRCSPQRDGWGSASSASRRASLTQSLGWPTASQSLLWHRSAASDHWHPTSCWWWTPGNTQISVLVLTFNPNCLGEHTISYHSGTTWSAV